MNKAGTKKWLFLTAGSVGVTVAVIATAASMSIFETVLLAIGVGSLAGALGRYCKAQNSSEK
ncbi:hypothetical protein [Candidatus Rariloculus sp.]|uniref:hypothetical protein n=1 Tax=Candidatus Rariloculus sp. TaxID=3101265 RepID=UPI003D0E3145